MKKNQVISNNSQIFPISTVTLGPLTEKSQAFFLLCDTIPVNLLERDLLNYTLLIILWVKGEITREILKT